MIEELQRFGFRLHDVFLAGVIVGMWWTGRNRRTTGERLGVLEDGIAELRGLLKAIAGPGETK